MQGNISTLVRDWTERRFTMNSGYYAGRRPSAGDLGEKHLEMIYVGIRDNVGQNEASNFVRFVNKLDDMSASAFIVAFEQFWANDCRIIEVVQKVEDRTRLSGHGDVLMDQAFGSIMSTLFGGVDDGAHRRLSEGVKAVFILNHLDEIPKEDRQELHGLPGYCP